MTALPGEAGPREVLAGRLKEHGLKLTRERCLVFEELICAARAVSRSELAEQLQSKGIYPATLYRTIDAFVRAQVVQEIPRSGEVLYELLPPFTSHHHHFHCLGCGALMPLDVVDEPEESSVPGKALYHQVDVYGYCTSCL